MFEQIEQISKNIFSIMYKFHNSYFVFFVFFVIWVNLYILYISYIHVQVSYNACGTIQTSSNIYENVDQMNAGKSYISSTFYKFEDSCWSFALRLVLGRLLVHVSNQFHRRVGARFLQSQVERSMIKARRNITNDAQSDTKGRQLERKGYNK